MDTKGFFDLIWPSVGYRCMAVPGNKGLQQFFGSTNEWATQMVARLDGERGRTVYHACASFKDQSSRKAENVAAVRSFWMDIDVGERKPYAKFSDAVRHLISFCDTVGIVRPYIVKSGVGVHAYWPCNHDMTPGEWKVCADLLKEAAKRYQLGQDTTRTGDIASILRPVGSTHRKGDPKPVIMAIEGAVTTLAEFQTALATWMGEEAQVAAAFEMPAGRPPVGAVAANADLSGGMEYAPKSIAKVAERCAVVQLMRDEKGNVDQPTWYNVLGVMVHCVDGPELAHEWSSGHPQYTKGETDAKLAQQAKHGPTTCSKLSDCQPNLCAACPHNGKITSPIVLGYDAPALEVVTEDPVSPAAAPIAILLPIGYKWAKWGDRNCLQYESADEDGNQIWVPFCDTLFYIVNRIELGQGDGYAVEVEMQIDHEDGRKFRRRFRINSSLLGEGGKSLASILGNYEIVARPKMKPQLENYLSTWLDRLKTSSDLIHSHRAFGWTEDRNFVVGNRMITRTGDRHVILDDPASQVSDALTPSGSLEEWVRIIDRAYNAPHQEAFQFCVLSAFAAPLFAMYQQFGGVTVYAQSAASGVGKTTAQRAGISAWGDWDQLQLSDGKVTQNAMWALVGAYCNLPVMFDELTNTGNKEASEVVFSISSGRAKQRLDQTGKLRQNNSNWSTIVMASGNNLLSEKLALHRANAEAEISRLFEFTVDVQAHIDPNEAADLFPLLRAHYGYAGQEFIRYVTRNYDAVEQVLWGVLKKFNVEVGATQSERYWAALCAAVLTSLKLCQKLGLVDFDTVAFRSWVIKQFNANRSQRMASVNDPLDQFGTMLSELWQGILVTRTEGNLRSRPPQPAIVVTDPRGAMIGRCILGDQSGQGASLYLNVQSVRDWCNSKGVSAREIETAARHHNWFISEPVRYVLGRGTERYGNITTQVRCWVMDPIRMGIDVNHTAVVHRPVFNGVGNANGASKP